MRRLGIVGIALAAGIGQALVAQNTGVISGTVLDEKGKIYSEGARVMIVKAPERPDGFEPFAASVIAAKDGKYRVANLAPGKA